jgi:hypothetical protein
VPSVETYGVEPIPPELRTVRWRDLLAIDFTLFLNPSMWRAGCQLSDRCSYASTRSDLL